MTTEPYSGALIAQLKRSGQSLVPQGYFRSKLFIAPFATNPIVAGAGPLLSLLERLCISPSLPEIQSIRDNIDHELRAFQCKLLGLDISEELIVIAYYLLTATIDELLGKNYMRLHGEVAEFIAFTPSSYNETGPEKRFFEIISYLKDKPSQYLDLIELSYFCLIAGFEGEQHATANGRQVLDDLIEELYQLILKHRVNKPHRLFREQTTDFASTGQFKPLIAASALAITLLSTALFISHFLLENKANQVLFGHQVVARLEN